MPDLRANSLPKEERLCGKTTISTLVAEGRWGTTAHLKYCWHKSREDGAARVAVSVSKKFFKRAVKRNLLKRRIREAYRTQKQLLPPSCGIDMLLIWSGKELADYRAIRSEVTIVLGRIGKASMGTAAGAMSSAEAGFSSAPAPEHENGDRQ